MFPFNPLTYGPQIAELLEGAPPCVLGPGKANSSFRDRLLASDMQSLLQPKQIVDRDMSQCCAAGLWLLYNFLDQSHEISQAIHTTTGSYWHGIMHRREGDFSNSKYWFRRVGDHEIFPALCEGARELSKAGEADNQAKFLIEQSSWDPFWFVDFCQAAVRDRSNSEQLCRQMAQLEWQLLFDHCYHRAVGELPSARHDAL